MLIFSILYLFTGIARGTDWYQYNDKYVQIFLISTFQIFPKFQSFDFHDGNGQAYELEGQQRLLQKTR